jgi:hypothetical protein
VPFINIDVDVIGGTFTTLQHFNKCSFNITCLLLGLNIHFSVSYEMVIFLPFTASLIGSPPFGPKAPKV